jgi:malate dehydrogenase (oxaloacetate-decarboxylating)
VLVKGTATITLAGLINALKIVGKDKRKVKVTMIGVGAANMAIARLMFADGFKPENMIFVDSIGTLHTERKDLEAEQVKGGITDSLVGADICIALSRSGPDTIRPDWLKKWQRMVSVFSVLILTLPPKTVAP